VSLVDPHLVDTLRFLSHDVASVRPSSSSLTRREMQGTSTLTWKILEISGFLELAVTGVSHEAFAQ